MYPPNCPSHSFLIVYCYRHVLRREAVLQNTEGMFNLDSCFREFEIEEPFLLLIGETRVLLWHHASRRKWIGALAENELTV